MKTKTIAIIPMILVLVTGCQNMPVAISPNVASPGYSDSDSIATSLFPSDQAVLNDEAVARILSSKLELPAKAKLAVMRFPDSERRRTYWRDAEYLKLREAEVQMLSKALLASDQITDVTPLPSLMTPAQVSIPVLREAAVRMQADLLLVYRIGSDTYWRYRAFSKDQIKAFSTCEMVLLDVRTGLVPFARVISRERVERKLPTDFDTSETMRRAEESSASDALNSAGEELVKFLKTVPQR